MTMELMGKIFIVTLGIASVVGLLLLLAGACDIIANAFRETHKEYFADDPSNHFECKGDFDQLVDDFINRLKDPE